MVDTGTLQKYELDGIFKRQGLHSFFLVNVESFLYLFLTSQVTFWILWVLRGKVLKGKDPQTLKEKDLSLLNKQVVKKSEALEWNGMLRQLMVCMLQTLLFAIL